MTAGAARPVRPRRDGDDRHVPFVAASLAFGVLGGFSLAVSLPIEVAIGSVDISWVAHAQVHGHLQFLGFAGLFVVGMALRLMPRFGGGGDLQHPRAVRPLFLLLVFGMVCRALGQPLADVPAFAALLAAGAIAELLGALLFLLVAVRTLAPALREASAPAWLLAGAAVGFVSQAAFGAIWLCELALDGGTVLPFDRNATLVNLQLFGTLLPAILGVGLRTFPTFFGRPHPSSLAGRAIAAAAIGGSAAWTAGRLVEVYSDAAPWALLDAGQAMVGLAILGAIAAFGPWRSPRRLAPASRGLAWAIQPVALWLALTGVLLIATAIQSAVAAEAVGASTLDAVRHLFAVGVVTLAIVGMAQLMLPEFASERLVRGPTPRRGPIFGAILSVAVVLRALVPLAGLEGEERWWSMAAAGAIAWLAVAAFAVLVWRARRTHRAHVARISAARASELPMRS